MKTATTFVPEFHTTRRAVLNRASHDATLALEAAFSEHVAAHGPKPLGAPIQPYVDRQKAADRALRGARWAKAEADRAMGA